MLMIYKANFDDLQEILQLQYLSYQSEAALFGSKDIPPLKQTLDEVIEEYFPNKRYELFTSTRSKENIRLYQSLGYKIFDSKAINDELQFVYMEKV